MSKRGLTLVRNGIPALVILGALLLGGLCGRPPAGKTKAGADPAAGHFLAGSERSLPVLEEISATVKRIDERLARLEKLAVQSAGAGRKE